MPESCAHEQHTHTDKHEESRALPAFSLAVLVALTSSTCSMPVYQHVWHLVCLVCSPTRARFLSHAFFLCLSNEHCLPLSCCALHTSTTSLTSTAATSCFASRTSTAALSCAASSTSTASLSPTLSHTLALFPLLTMQKTGISCAQTTTKQTPSALPCSLCCCRQRRCLAQLLLLTVGRTQSELRTTKPKLK